MNESRLPPSGGAAPTDRGTPQILVVDDEAPIRELVGYVLESHGFRVRRARNSREALCLTEAFPGAFQLLFTDICMKPHDDGFALARALRSQHPDLRIIYASGFVEPARLQEEIEGSGALFLPKPFTPNALLDCVRRSLALTTLA